MAAAFVRRLSLKDPDIQEIERLTLLLDSALSVNEIQVNWAANMALVDAVNGCTSQSA